MAGVEVVDADNSLTITVRNGTDRQAYAGGATEHHVVMQVYRPEVLSDAYAGYVWIGTFVNAYDRNSGIGSYLHPEAIDELIVALQYAQKINKELHAL